MKSRHESTQHSGFKLSSSPMIDAVRRICVTHRLSETREAMLAFAIQNLATAIAEAHTDEAAVAISFPVIKRGAPKADNPASSNPSNNRDEDPRNNKPKYRHFRPPVVR